MMVGEETWWILFCDFGKLFLEAAEIEARWL